MLTAMSLRYYLYVSPSKVEMLYAQIPRGFLDGVSAELKVHLGIVGTTLKQDAAPTNLYARVRVVEDYIRSHAMVGSLDAPADYVYDVASVRWGPYLHNDTGIVFFGGKRPRVVFGLGGSLSSVVGQAPSLSVHSSSASPYLIDVLAAALDLPPSMTQETEGLALEDKSASALWAVRIASERLSGPSQTVEFLAKRLLMGTVPYADQRVRVFLGMPIYVALKE